MHLEFCYVLPNCLSQRLYQLQPHEQWWHWLFPPTFGNNVSWKMFGFVDQEVKKRKITCFNLHFFYSTKCWVCFYVLEAISIFFLWTAQFFLSIFSISLLCCSINLCPFTCHCNSILMNVAVYIFIYFIYIYIYLFLYIVYIYLLKNSWHTVIVALHCNIW